MNTGISTGPNSVYVEWDTCMRFPYHFETSANSKVVVCNEPRILLRERIAVGCLVERGKYFFLCHINWLPNLCDVNCSYSPIYNDFIYSFQLSFLLSFIYYFGIFVLPGQDWKWSDQDGGEGSVGFVYRVKEDQTIYVSIVWGNTENGGKEFDKKNCNSQIKKKLLLSNLIYMYM